MIRLMTSIALATLPPSRVAHRLASTSASQALHLPHSLQRDRPSCAALAG